MLSLTRQEPWFAAFLLSEARNYRSRGIREIQAGAWAVGTLIDSFGNVVTPATVADASWVLMAPFFEEQRAPALLVMRDAEVNDWYVQYGVLNHGAVNDALRENSRIIVRAGPAQFGLEASEITVRPPVRGLGDVQSVLELFDRDMLTTTGGVMVGPLDVIDVDGSSPRTQAVNKGYVDSLVLGVTRFIGRIDAEIDQVYYTEPSGILPSPGRLITAAEAGGGAQIVVELPGVMPDDSVLPGLALSYGDMLLSDGTAWYHFPLRAQQVTGTMVALVPQVFGRDDVQGALEVAATQMAGRVQKVGDTITGTLNIDVGVPGLPSLYIRQPAGSSTAALHIIGNPTGPAMSIDGNVNLGSGDLQLLAGNMIINNGAISAMLGYIMSRQFYLGIDFNCGYLLGPDATSGGLWRNNTGQLTLRRPPGQTDIYSEDNNGVTRYRLLTELDRAPPLVVEPPALSYYGGDAWRPYWSGTYPIPRGGNSRIRIAACVNVTIANPGGALNVGVRCTQNNIERRVFVYQQTGTSIGSGFVIEMHVDVTGTNPALDLTMALLDPGSMQITTLDSTSVMGRSQILITDLGPR